MAKEEAINQIVTRIKRAGEVMFDAMNVKGWILHIVIRGCGHITYKLVVIGYESVNVMFE